jgi:hypothetical protein
MSNFLINQLQASITAAIKTNGNEEITGPVLQAALVSIVQTLWGVISEPDDYLLNQFPAYGAGTTYVAAEEVIVKHDSALWVFVSDTDQTGVTPGVNAAVWTAINSLSLAHFRNKDSGLDLGGAHEVSAQTIVEFIAAMGLDYALELESEASVNDKAVEVESVVSETGQVAKLILDGSRHSELSYTKANGDVIRFQARESEAEMEVEDAAGGRLRFRISALTKKYDFYAQGSSTKAFSIDTTNLTESVNMVTQAGLPGNVLTKMPDGSWQMQERSVNGVFPSSGVTELDLEDLAPGPVGQLYSEYDVERAGKPQSAAFPLTPSDYQKHFRKDLGLMFHFDQSRGKWLSEYTREILFYDDEASATIDTALQLNHSSITGAGNSVKYLDGEWTLVGMCIGNSLGTSAGSVRLYTGTTGAGTTIHTETYTGGGKTTFLLNVNVPGTSLKAELTPTAVDAGEGVSRPEVAFIFRKRQT